IRQSSATNRHLGPNVRHERQPQAQLEAVRSMEGLGLANSGTTCAQARPTTERVFCSLHRPAAPHLDALPATRRRADGSRTRDPGDNNATDSGEAAAHARPAPPGGGAPAATRLDVAWTRGATSIAHNRG